MIFPDQPAAGRIRYNNPAAIVSAEEDMKTIYLDYNASTPVDPAVLEAMLPYFKNQYGNPSSTHSYGLPLKSAIQNARAQVANLLGCKPTEIVFTSGASESNNWVVKSMALSTQRAHIITSQVEHPSILNSCHFVETLGAEVTYLPVDGYGSVEPADVEKAITPQTKLISIMHANNEVGTIQRIPEIAAIAQRHGVTFHSDAAQSVGKIRTNVMELGVDLMSVAGHKLYAPKGVGALYVRSGIQLEPLIHGAGQESGFRSGTENAAFAAALGKACELAQQDLTERKSHTEALRNYFQGELGKQFGDLIVVNGHPERRLPNTMHVSFRNVTGVDLLNKIPGLAASTGAACHSGIVHLSATLKAMGISPEIGAGSVRFSLGRYTTREEIDHAIELLRRNYHVSGTKS